MARYAYNYDKTSSSITESSGSYEQWRYFDDEKPSESYTQREAIDMVNAPFTSNMPRSPYILVYQHSKIATGRQDVTASSANKAASVSPAVNASSSTKVALEKPAVKASSSNKVKVSQDVNASSANKAALVSPAVTASSANKVKQARSVTSSNKAAAASSVSPAVQVASSNKASVKEAITAASSISCKANCIQAVNTFSSNNEMATVKQAVSSASYINSFNNSLSFVTPVMTNGSFMFNDVNKSVFFADLMSILIKYSYYYIKLKFNIMIFVVLLIDSQVIKSTPINPNSSFISQSNESMMIINDTVDSVAIRDYYKSRGNCNFDIHYLCLYLYMLKYMFI